MNTLPEDYTFCNDRFCPLRKECLRAKYPKTDNLLLFQHFESEWDESLKKYVCDMQIKPSEYKNGN